MKVMLTSYIWSSEVTVQLYHLEQVDDNNVNPKAFYFGAWSGQMFLPHSSLTPRPLRFKILLGIRYPFIN